MIGWRRTRPIELPVPRLLPLTILAMAALTVLKAVALAHLAMAGGQAATGQLATGGQAADPPLMMAQAMAQTAPAAAPPAAEPPPATRPAPAMPAAAAPAPGAMPAGKEPAAVSDSERQLLLDLRARRNELDERQKALDARQAVLDATERKLGERVAELTTLQNKLEALETARKQREEANWAGLVKAYEVMKPRDAAAIFNDLEMPVLLQILDRMKDTKVAPVLAAMQTDRARDATTKLAQMRLRENTIGNSAGGNRTGTAAGAPPSPGG
jgi:flagellar motility protein MotE (MotC chaperone)